MTPLQRHPFRHLGENHHSSSRSPVRYMHLVTKRQIEPNDGQSRLLAVGAFDIHCYLCIPLPITPWWLVRVSFTRLYIKRLRTVNICPNDNRWPTGYVGVPYEGHRTCRRKICATYEATCSYVQFSKLQRTVEVGPDPTSGLAFGVGNIREIGLHSTLKREGSMGYL